MQRMGVFFFAILAWLPVTVLSSIEPKPYICDGKYKNGGKPNQATLRKILDNHASWLKSKGKKGRKANLCNANLSNTNLYKANLIKANLQGANLKDADLRKAILMEANVRNANLYGALLSQANLAFTNLNGTNLIGADLSRSDLFFTNLTGAKIGYADLRNTRYEPISPPDKALLLGLHNLETVYFNKEGQAGLVLLRKALKETGLRKLEREATYALEKGKTNHASSWLNNITRLLFFEYTAGYGLYPGRCLLLLLSFIPIFSLIYFFSVYRKKETQKHNSLATLFSPPATFQMKSGIYRIWSDERIRQDLGSRKPELLSEGFIKSVGYALYFSILSAFHIGWRDINVGNWIARIQPREYTLRATGWVRTVSGIQSLISIYLLAFWVLTQFGRPFD